MAGISPARPPFRLAEDLQAPVEEALRRAVEEDWAGRIWRHDVSVWPGDEEVGRRIANRLGWLGAPATFRERVEELEAFASGVRSEGFAQAVVCGMGGSSLAPEVLARTFALADPGIPVHVLDSTDPAAVLGATDAWDPARTLYLIATKSGTTTETLAFLAYFWHVEDELHGAIPDGVPGEHFVAITDPGKSLDAIPHAEAFRGVFLNPEDVGGRYSALTYVGLVPGALLGIDLRGLLDGALEMAARCRASEPSNPGLALGVALGALARAGRDKLTFVIEPRYASLGAWLEQLIAESTGKHGTGVVPVDGEPLAGPEAYGDDRVFVRLAAEAASDWRDETDRRLEALEAAGHPVIDLRWDESTGLGGEFFRWEFATAVAGAVLGIDPFDEPNVTESKENTQRVLDESREQGALPRTEPLVEAPPLALVADAPLRLTAGPGTLDGELARHLARARERSYIALQAYLAATPERDALLRDLQRLLRDRTGRATTLGYGPRFLHSTGQLHKGGPRIGCFIQLLGGHPQDAAIPGREESFGTLIDAQALGDFASLEGHDLPVIRIELGADVDAGLRSVRDAVARALDRLG